MTSPGEQPAKLEGYGLKKFKRKRLDNPPSKAFQAEETMVLLRHHFTSGRNPLNKKNGRREMLAALKKFGSRTPGSHAYDLGREKKTGQEESSKTSPGREREKVKLTGGRETVWSQAMIQGEEKRVLPISALEAEKEEVHFRLREGVRREDSFPAFLERGGGR